MRLASTLVFTSIILMTGVAHATETLLRCDMRVGVLVLSKLDLRLDTAQKVVLWVNENIQAKFTEETATKITAVHDAPVPGYHPGNEALIITLDRVDLTTTVMFAKHPTDEEVSKCKAANPSSMWRYCTALTVPEDHTSIGECKVVAPKL